MLPVAWILVASNLSLPQRAYTGISIQPDGRIGSVDPGSPGAIAGLVPGDRLRSPGAGRAEQVLSPGPLANATPGTPLVVERERGGVARVVWLVPRPLPDAERRYLAVLFAVAGAFALLGSWVWMERRDRLTRTFYLLCLTFTVLLAPPPRFHAAPAVLAYELFTVLAQLFAGPLFSHFFALFPESGRPRARGWVLGGYAAATVLLASYAGVRAGPALGADGIGPLLALLQMGPAVLFAAGLLGGLVLFALAFARAENADARRRLRVAFIGTLLGALPFAVLVGLRNLSAAPVIPGERWAVLTLLLVPVSFGWAMAVHNVFDFRVALRAFTRAAGALVGAGVLYVAGEWASAAWWPGAGPGAVGSALAGLALLAALAGPARGWLGAVGRRLVPIEDEASLADWSPAGEDEPQLLHAACDAVVRALRVDGCCALHLDGGGAVLARAGALLAPALSPAAPDAFRHASGPHAPAELRLGHEDRDALEQTGARWLVPVNAHVALAIGRRFAGAWLSRAESRALERMARLLAVGLENLELRREARGHEGFAREMREAHAVQARRLPRRTPVFPTLDCAASTLATEAVGGDYYDFVETGGREFTLAVGDAAGHGVPAALVLAGVQARFRDEARRANHPAELLEAMNRDLVALEQPEKFMGLLCARVDAGSGLVRFANAGLTPPLLRRRDGRREPLTESGVLLGVQDGARYAHTQSELEPGDVLVVYTDGLTEAPREGEPFGEERMWEVIDRHAHRRAADLLEELMNAVRAWADGPLDDLTIVVLKQLARSRGPAAMRT
jgi:serine phosphatase RsbU (regulator of sigma subunit)